MSMRDSALGEALGPASVMLRVRDIHRSLLWFEKTLGLKPFVSGADGSHPYAAFALGGTGVALWQLQPEEPDPETNLSSTYVVFSVNSAVEELRDRLISLGAQVGELRESAVARFFWFYDPDGHRFEVSQFLTPPAA